MPKLILIPLILILTSCATQPSPQTPERIPSSKKPPFSKTLKPLIEDWIRRDPKKMVDVLKDIPQEHRQHFTLVRESHSLQKSSDLYPRALLFGKTGGTIFTFNGDPKLGGYDALEIADFNEDEKKLYLYEVRFKNEPSAGSADDYIILTEDEIFHESSNLQISKGNPAKCMNCHSARYKSDSQNFSFASYIWAEYPKWPRVYGGGDDNINFDPQSGERANFDKFKIKVKTSKEAGYERYRSLLFGPEKAYPYYAAKKNDFDDPNRVTMNMPNFRLTMFLGIRYSQMVANFILNEPELKANNSLFLKKWLKEPSEINIQYPLSLSDHSNENWVIGPPNLINFQPHLKDQVMAQVIHNLAPQNKKWKVPPLQKVPDKTGFYSVDPEIFKFLTEDGLRLLSYDDPGLELYNKFYESLDK